MKNILLIVNGVLLIAVIGLYILFFSCKQCETGKNKKPDFIKCDTTKKSMLPIAYINVDSLLLKYDFAKEQNERLLKRQENSRLTLSQKSRQFQIDYTDFQNKMQNNVYTTRERAEQENDRLMKKQQDLQGLEKRLTDELLSEQQKINEQLKDTIDTVLAEYNKDKGFHIILSNTMNDNILYADEKYDITTEIIDLLNSRYKKK